MNVQNDLLKTYNVVTDTIKQDYLKLKNLISEEHNEKIIEFINRVIEWRLDESKQHLFFQMFHMILSSDIRLFIPDLYFFVSNALLDDSSFEISWKEFDKGENDRLSFINQVGYFKTKLSDEANADSFPVVYWKEFGSQNVNLLLKAMDETEDRDKAQIERIIALEKEKLELLEKLGSK